MAVDVTFLNSGSSANIATNFERVEEAFQSVLGTSGDIPNSMEADLDINSNDILNAKNIYTSSLFIDGSAVVPTNLGSYEPNSVGTAQLINEAITEPKLGTGSVSNRTIASNSVSEDKVVNTATDALRITISQLAYPRLADRTGDPSAASANRIAIQSALNTKKYIELGEGDIRTDQQLILQPYNRLMGIGKPGSAITKLTIHSTVDPCILMSGLTPGMSIENLWIGRVGVPGFAAHGITASDYVDECNISNVRVEGHRIGVYLQGTGYSTFQDSLIYSNTSDGVRIENSGISSASQWYIDGLLIQTNGGHGIIAQGVTRGSAVSVLMGDWNNIRTFGNTGSGLALSGIPSVPVVSSRIRQCFIGGDGGLGELYMNTYGYGHIIQNSFFEYNRSGATGPGQATPINPDPGAGVYVSPNNLDVAFMGCAFSGNKGDGLISYATDYTGVHHCLPQYNTGYGLWFAEGNKAQVSSPMYKGNTTGTIHSASGVAEVVNAWPRSEGTTFMSGVAVGNPTGGVPAAGSLNAAGGLLKNNVAYTNP